MSGPTAIRDGDLAVYGHLQAGIGLGTAARGMLAALRAVGVGCRAYDLDRIATGQEAADGGHRISIVHTNPDHVARLLSSPGAAALARAFEDRYVIGAWVWESPGSLPPRATELLPLFDEIWSPSRFAADGIAGLLPCPVEVVPHAVDVRAPDGTGPDATEPDRTALGLARRAFLFLAVFDELSNLARKNPAGAVLAFRRAFPQPDGRAGLVLKARTLSPAGHRHLLRAAAGHPGIVLRVADEPAGRVLELIRACDALVSLHRAEGFGLAIAEAMALGRPAVVTGWSGNMDFTDTGNALLVRHRPIRLPAAEDCYPAGTFWAEPDIDHAARLMRGLAGEPEAACRLGARAAADIAHRLAPEPVGRLIRAHLERIAGQGPTRRRRVRIGGGA